MTIKFLGLKGTLQKLRGKKDFWNTFISGSISSLSILILEKEKGESTCRSLALYFMARVMQCFYNSAVQRGIWKFPGSSWNYWDSLLFILSTTQIMYVYVMRPDTLPFSYFNFIRNSGPIHAFPLESCSFFFLIINSF